MSFGYGNGKVILFGEHFVVYGAPSIVAAISNQAIVEVKKNGTTENRVITDLRVVPHLSLGGVGRVLDSLQINEKYDVYLTGDLPTYGGLGSSAAFSVALTRAFAKDNGFNLTNEDINRHAYEGEKAFHGNPSGVDNLAATYGGVFKFTRGKTYSENKFDPIYLKSTLDIVISFSGKYSGTPQMVAKVKELKDTDPEKFNLLLDSYRQIFDKALIAINKADINAIGQLMNENHSLLQTLGTSDTLNDQIVEVARKNGAIGAKVTGGGGGGCCIALAKNQLEAEKISKAITSAGFISFPTKIGTS
ncbi:MAG: mevalonate kinase [Candidatus Bilamarchaeum sp.]|jgi:mevalonate kinase